ncbi:MAG TPA: ATP-binding protein, partial [Terriglobales bacterium]
GPLGASTSLLVVVGLSFWGTARQLGPFVASSNNDEILSLQLFWIVLCIPVMLVAAVIRERELVEEALEEQRKQLAHVTRVATAGELSGALAHELSQPLAAILANAQAANHLLATHPENVCELREILADITTEDRQAVNIIDNLRSFMKEGQSQLERLAIENVVRDALALGRSTIEMSGVDVDIQIAAEIPRVRGDAIQLLQVLLNLIVNSCESMSSVPAPDRHLILRVARSDRAHVTIEIADHGVGLPQGSEDRIFEPFFTTKRKGMGLGLAICRSIATAHHGRLWATNNPNGGATFYLALPSEEAHGSTTAAA